MMALNITIFTTAKVNSVTGDLDSGLAMVGVTTLC